MEQTLYYTNTGRGEPLILLHGNGESRLYFQAQIAPLSQIRRVIAVDTRGHGQSPRGSAPFTLSQFADDLHALMDHLALPQADILGFSDGGNIALLFSLRYPTRVRKLILNGANLYPSGMRPLFWLLIDAAYALFCLASHFTAKAVRVKELFGLMATQPHIRPEQLRSLAMPVLVMAGTRDLIRDRHTRLIARSIPGCKLVILKGGHTIAQTCPEAYNAAVTAFLEG